MEKVKVVKSIPGILKVGDTLISPSVGADFCLEETEVTKEGSSERFVSLDYVTVSENIPKFFQFDVEEVESECINCGDCEDCDCVYTKERLEEEDIQIPGYVVRSAMEIADRYDFFEKRFNAAVPGSEAQVVYRNLMWFIEWLEGRQELL